ncbi:hypothetical protein CQA57_01290 [Helicobacter anseris]|uniref:Uncharacterized protein n=1 Tax=Helicobacter anseris TaxID=375926 RepID=A0A3D8JC11_9HELI|nr:hypothetical protein [Helicobacter anseris]RDU74374.1 hypothetical protein CQA57_01290 [Helicobacter anseris]
MEKHSYAAMIIFKEHLKVSHMDKKELKEYAESRGVEAKGVRMRELLGTLALAEAYDKLYEEYQILKEKAKK